MGSKTRPPYYCYPHHSKQTRSLTRAGTSASAHPEARPSGEPESESETLRRRNRPRTGCPLRYYHIRSHVQLRTRQGGTRPRSPSSSTRTAAATASGAAAAAAATALEPEAKTALNDSTVPELPVQRGAVPADATQDPDNQLHPPHLPPPNRARGISGPPVTSLQPLLLLLLLVLTLHPNILHLPPIPGIAFSSVPRPSLH